MFRWLFAAAPGRVRRGGAPSGLPVCAAMPVGSAASIGAAAAPSRATAFALLVASTLTAGCARAETLTISAAVSVSDVVSDIAAHYQASTGVALQVNTAASSVLARQIVDGAPVDVFISADLAQMEVVTDAGRVVPGTVVPLLTNQLVVVTRHDPAFEGFEPATLTDGALQRIAMGHPDSVPAGVYGRQWLERLGLWRTVQPKVVPLSTVRAALAAVREGRADLAIVYATDAATARELRVVYAVGPDEGPAIVYPAAVVRGGNEAAARRFLDHLRSNDARARFEAAGFGVVATR